MTVEQQILTIAICSLGTIATRFLPFLIFRTNKPLPKFVTYLGKALPAPLFAMLVVYCLKGVSLVSYSYGLPELIAIVVVIALHLWKKQMILSISLGTICYMLLVQFVFV